MGPPTLTVRDIELESRFYTEVLDLQVMRRHTSKDDREVKTTEMLDLGFAGSKDPLLMLRHDPSARRPTRNSAGLFHFAILVPDRKSLAYAHSSISSKKHGFDGFGDHLVSESLYLHDPESNGIEIYRDRPKAEWPRDENGMILMDTLPLDLEGISSELPEAVSVQGGLSTFPNGARIGHVHLKVTDLERSLRFYREKLGLKLTADWSRNGADFLAAGDYHHHVGMNTWSSLGGKVHEDGESGLDNFSIVVPNRSDLETLAAAFGSYDTLRRNADQLLLADPDGIRVLVQHAR